jgi:HTH-type transcriptional regulator / antitoxin HigA
MAHVLDPAQLRDDTQYVAALDELEDLMLADPDTPGGRRFDELVRLIEDYEVRRDGYDLDRMKRALAAALDIGKR